MEPARAILVATLGGSWGVIPEAYGFTNPQRLPLYREHPERETIQAARQRHRIPPVSEIHVITTAGAPGKASLRQWAAKIGVPLKLCWPAGVEDLNGQREAAWMAELIHRMVLAAHYRTGVGGRVVLSLAGGRKTMSADLQRAGEVFGHHGLIHILDRNFNPEKGKLLRAFDFTGPLPPPLQDTFLPIVVAGSAPGNEALDVERERLHALIGELPNGPVTIEDTPLLDAVTEIRRRAENLLANFHLQLAEEDKQGNFPTLYLLPRRRLHALRNQRIGTDPAQAQRDLEWLRRLPKAELHCHLGGILHSEELIEVASAESERLSRLLREHPPLMTELQRLEHWARAGDLQALGDYLGRDDNGALDFKRLRRVWPELPEPLGVCAFLLAFRHAPQTLDALIFGPWRDPAAYHAIGIERYEALGDLQGSGLLQSRATLRAALAVLARQAKEHHIRYLELRCSPLNMTRGGLSGEDVVGELLTAAEAMAPQTDLRLLFIASRHGDRRRIRDHIRLAQRLLRDNEAFAHRFVGFDLAGAEHARAPAELRDDFRPLRERVIHLTIHAGEGEDADNIWQAVYELNADRIGHGLTLHQRPELQERLRDRGVALEMCPSSNDQIVGFRDHLLGRGERTYPLLDYLEAGLRVTVNTDDPGMSRTDLSREYLKAATLTPGGLSRWQILQLIRNGFAAAFCSRPHRRDHLLQAERSLIDQLTCHEEGSDD